MKPTPLRTLAEWSGGALIQGRPGAFVEGVATDSRNVAPTDLFVALKGERFDAHDFLAQVSDANAAAMLVSSLPGETESFGGGVIFVRDTLKALQDIARKYRKACRDLTVVGITGSNGKTSTKDFLASVLEQAGGVSGTAGNLNNHIGVPLTILSTAPDSRFGVWEMGMNHSGEIEVLTEIAAPDAAVITHIGTAHIEHLETRDAIAEEKSQLPRAVPGDGYCVMPCRDDYYEYMAGAVDCEMIPVGGENGRVRAESVRTSEDGKAVFRMVSDFADPVEVTLPVRGDHMVQNALLAAAVGFREGLAVEAVAFGLEQARLTGGRLEERDLHGVTVLDDSYNANPDSMRAAIRTVAEADAPGKRVAVLGFMGELGSIEKEAHLELGKFVACQGIDVLVTVGQRARNIHDGAREIETREHFSTHEEAAGFLESILQPGDLVLFKGSRAADMGKVLELLEPLKD